MATQSTFEIHDGYLKGSLRKLLREWRSSDPPDSYDRISKRLLVEKGIDVSVPTVGRWCKRIEQEGDTCQQRRSVTSAQTTTN